MLEGSVAEHLRETENLPYVCYEYQEKDDSRR